MRSEKDSGEGACRMCAPKRGCRRDPIGSDCMAGVLLEFMCCMRMHRARLIKARTGGLGGWRRAQLLCHGPCIRLDGLCGFPARQLGRLLLARLPARLPPKARDCHHGRCLARWLLGLRSFRLRDGLPALR